MDISNVFGGETLKAADLQGRDIPVIISKVEMKKFDNGNKLILQFEGKKKALVCNKTNSKRIAMMYGNNTDLWVGQEITLYTDLVTFQGGEVEAIRVKVVRHQPAQQAPRPSTEQPKRQTGGISDTVVDRDMDDEIPF